MKIEFEWKSTLNDNPGLDERPPPVASVGRVSGLVLSSGPDCCFLKWNYGKCNGELLLNADHSKQVEADGGSRMAPTLFKPSLGVFVNPGNGVHHWKSGGGDNGFANGVQNAGFHPECGSQIVDVNYLDSRFSISRPIQTVWPQTAWQTITAK